MNSLNNLAFFQEFFHFYYYYFYLDNLDNIWLKQILDALKVQLKELKLIIHFSDFVTI